MQFLFKRLLAFTVIAIFAFTQSTTAFAFADNPTPYDPTDHAAEIDSIRSSSRFFILDALLPPEYQRALDDRKFIGITGFSFSGANNLPGNDTTQIFANDSALLTQSSYICSAYSSDICFDISRFYTPRIPQIAVTGLFALDGSTILQWGVNTGFDSPKLTVSPAIMIGLAKRFYFSEARNMHVIFEASTWIGERVKHRPCLDDFDRQFYCGNLSAWSDFTYDPRPQSNFFKITFEALF